MKFSFSYSQALFSSVLFVWFPFLAFIKPPGYNPLSWQESTITISLLLICALSFGSTKTVGPTHKTFLAIITVLIVYQVTLLLGDGLSGSGALSIMLHDRYILVAAVTPIIFRQAGERYSIILIVLSGLFAAYLAILKIIGDPTILQDLFSIRSVGRESSIFPNPNVFGVYLTIISLLVFNLTSSAHFKKKLTLFVIVLAPIMLVLLLSFSRRSWGMLLLGLAVYVVFKKGKRLYLLVSMFIFSLPPMFVFDYSRILLRFQNMFDGSYESNAVRISASWTHLSHLNQSFATVMIGDGVGASGPASSFAKIPRWIVIDSYYIQYLLEFGVIGTSIYVLAFGFVFLKSWVFLRTASVSHNLYNDMLMYLIIISLLYFAAVVGGTPMTFPLNIIQWYFVGLVILKLDSNIKDSRRKNAGLGSSSDVQVGLASL